MKNEWDIIVRTQMEHTKTPVIEELLIDKIQKKVVGKYRFTHTKHSFQRSLERNIKSTQLLAVLVFGIQFQKQNLIFHVASHQSMANCSDSSTGKHLVGLVVVTDITQSVIITCYRNKHSLKNLRKKPKFHS
jgi:hypothetical protein